MRLLCLPQEFATPARVPRATALPPGPPLLLCTDEKERLLEQLVTGHRWRACLLSLFPGGSIFCPSSEFHPRGLFSHPTKDFSSKTLTNILALLQLSRIQQTSTDCPPCTWHCPRHAGDTKMNKRSISPLGNLWAGEGQRGVLT